MKRQDIKDALEVIGFIAIIASLVFVGMETRNGARQTELNTRAIEIAAYQDLIDNISDINRLTVESESVARLMYKAFQTDEELSEIEALRVSRAFFLRIRHGDMAYFQYERGAIDEERLRSVLQPLNLGDRRVREFWKERQYNFSSGYRDYMNELIAEIESRQ
jgi:hypothetical protein